jgi:hypothetical protein
LLTSFLFFTPLAAGLVVWSAVVALFHGRWDAGIERWALAGIAFAPLSLAAYVVLWMGRSHWATWLKIALPGQATWFNETFVFSRDFGGLVLLWGVAWWYVRLRQRGRPGAVAAGLALAYAGVMTILSFDLAMSLDPRWYSTLFGGYFLMSGLYAAATVWTLAALISRTADRSQRHDLGMLLVAVALVTTYLMYSQLLPIWYGNLPRETRFLTPRTVQSPWRGVSAALLGAAWLGPLVLLLSRRAKQWPLWLGAVSALALGALWVERWWLVAPTLGGLDVPAAPAFAATAFFAGALGLALCRFAPPEPAELHVEVDAE